jgi:hypothetical protein
MDPHFLDILQKIVATFAFLVGGFWVLMNYVRNRTHVPRLQVDVKAEIIARENRRYLLATIQIKNHGLSIITLPPHSEKGAGPLGSGLMVSPLRDREAESDLIEVTATKEDVQTFDVLENHTSIEPGLTINQQKLLRLPKREYDAFWVRLRVLAHKQSWSAVAIATQASDLPNRS